MHAGLERAGSDPGEYREPLALPATVVLTVALWFLSWFCSG